MKEYNYKMEKIINYQQNSTVIYKEEFQSKLNFNKKCN